MIYNFPNFFCFSGSFWPQIFYLGSPLSSCWSLHLPHNFLIFWFYGWKFLISESLVFWDQSELTAGVERRRQWHPTPVLLPGKSHGWRSLVGHSPWSCEGSDTTERLHFHFSLSCIGEGNGNPLQCSCLENPRDGSLVGCRLWGHRELDMTDWLSSSGFHQEVRCVSCVCVSVCVKWTVIPFSLAGFATEQIISSLHSLLQNFWRVSQICSLLHWSKGGYYLATAILFWSSLFDSVKAMSSGILLKTWSSWFFLTLVWFGSKSISGKEFYSNGAGISSCVGYFHRLHLIVFFFFKLLYSWEMSTG